MLIKRFCILYNKMSRDIDMRLLVCVWLIWLVNILYSQNLGFSTPKIVSNNFPLAKRLDIGDLDQDGDPDIIATSSNQNTTDPNVAWFENIGSGFVQHNVDLNFQTAREARMGDLDNDGFNDIAAVNRNSTPIVWWKNTLNTSWSSNTLQNFCMENHAIVIVDLNQDGYLDIVSAEANNAVLGPDSCVFWYENSSVNPGTFTLHIINQQFQQMISLDVLDLDGDGDLDILGTEVGLVDEIADDEVVWFENDGNQNFTQREVDFNSDAPMYVRAGDVDNDGDKDILVCDWGHVDGTSHDVFWYENDGKSGADPTKIWVKHQIDNAFYNARSTEFVDLDGDGDLDVVGAACDQVGLGSGQFPSTGGYVTYWLNDGSPLDGGWTRVDLITDFDYAYHALAEDMDDDGDPDIVASAQDSGAIFWWENTVNDSAINLIVNNDYFLWNNKVRINFSSGPTGAEKVKVFYNRGTVPDRTSLGSGVDHVATNGFYTLKTDMSSYTCDIEFSYAGISEWSNITNESTLILCVWDGTQWIPVNNQNVKTTVDSILVSNFARSTNDGVKFTLGSSTADNPLPVQLASFTAQNTEEGIVLNWKTASELNNLGFEIWRAEDKDSLFEMIADYTTYPELEGAGTSNVGNSYSFLDANVREGKTYLYKLADIDFNLQRMFHGSLKITYLKQPLANTFQLLQNYPNPFNGVTNIPVVLPLNLRNFHNKAELRIYDLLGKLVKRYNLSSYSGGMQIIRWDARDQHDNMVASGNYVYQLVVGEFTISKKLVYLK
ncbi:MAG: T9SS C-terminal target domain-containing protein [Calditrichaeota bacterium]|nr:MAG: T9SS C-terminal target domain-containing protein [Calditrichota bacterium]